MVRVCAYPYSGTIISPLLGLEVLLMAENHARLCTSFAQHLKTIVNLLNVT